MPNDQPIANVLSVLQPIQASKHLMASKLYQVAFQTTKTYLLSFDISFEISKYLHENGVVTSHQILFSLNLDKDKLEREMRLFFVARKLDSQKTFSESEMLQTTCKFFGPKFTQKQDLIAKEESAYSE